MLEFHIVSYPPRAVYYSGVLLEVELDEDYADTHGLENNEMKNPNEKSRRRLNLGPRVIISKVGALV